MGRREFTYFREVGIHHGWPQSLAYSLGLASLTAQVNSCYGLSLTGWQDRVSLSLIDCQYNNIDTFVLLLLSGKNPSLHMHSLPLHYAALSCIRLHYSFNLAAKVIVRARPNVNMVGPCFSIYIMFFCCSWSILMCWIRIQCMPGYICWAFFSRAQNSKWPP